MDDSLKPTIPGINLNLRSHDAVRRVRALAQRFTYKPDSYFEVMVDYSFGDLIHCSWVRVTDDSEHPGEKTNVQATERHIARDIEAMDDEAVVRFIKRGWQRLERHEVDEWCRFDGKVVDEPHPERQIFGRRDAFAPAPKAITGLAGIIESVDALIPLQEDWRP